MFFSTDKGKEVFVFLFISCREKKKKVKFKIHQIRKF